MPGLRNPLFSLGATGRLTRALTLARRLTGPGWLLRGRPADPKTQAQMTWRNMYHLATSLWHQLSAAERDEWERDATPRGMTGYAWYMSQALRPNPGIYLPLAGGTMAGDIDMDGHQLEHLPAPAAAGDAARKAYVDAAIAAAALGQGARIRRTAHQTIATGGAYKAVIFQATDYDNDGMWEVANPTRLTFKTAGIFLISAQIGWAANAAGYRGHFISHSVDGAIANVTTDQADANNIWRGTLSTTWSCLAEEYIELYVYQNSGVPLDCQAAAFQYPVLQAVRIG